MAAPTRVKGYDVIPTAPAENWFVLDPVRPYNQTAKCMMVGWYDNAEDGKYLAATFSTEDDIDKLRKLRDGLTDIIETKLRHSL